MFIAGVFVVNFSALLLAFTWSTSTMAQHAEQSELIPREVLLGNPERTRPSLSPDGKKVAWVAPDDGVLNIWVRTLGEADEQVVTNNRTSGLYLYFWQYDSEHLLYIQDPHGKENPHVYQTNLDTRLTRDLTPFEGVRGNSVSPSIVHSGFPAEMLIRLNMRDRRTYDVFRVNLKNGAVNLDTENPGDVLRWTTDNNFEIRVAQVFAPDGGKLLRIRDNSKDPWRDLQKWSPDETFGGLLGFTKDNNSIYLNSSVEASATRLLQLNLSTGVSEVLAEDPDYDVGAVLINHKTRKVEAVQFVRARREWTVLDESLKTEFDALKSVRDGDLSIVSRDLADKLWLVAYSVDDGPKYYYIWNRAQKSATLLFSNRPNLENYRLAKMEAISYDARDGLTIHGYLTIPVDKEPKDLPMVLKVHGGPYLRDTWGFSSEVQWLANRGYAVLQVNFRGSTGYGKDFLNAGDREWGGKMQDDLIDGVNWAIEKGIADPARICIMGFSYGGFASLVGVTSTPDVFKCGVSQSGISNLITWMNTTPPYWAALKSLMEKRIGSVESQEEFLRLRSPLFMADRIKVPLLVSHGVKDPRVKQKESEQIVEAVRNNGMDVEYLLFPDESHGLRKPENRLAFYAAAEAFLAQHLGGRAEPPTEAETELLNTVRR